MVREVERGRAGGEIAPSLGGAAHLSVFRQRLTAMEVQRLQQRIMTLHNPETGRFPEIHWLSVHLFIGQN